MQDLILWHFQRHEQFQQFLFQTLLTELSPKQRHCANNEAANAEEIMGKKSLEKVFLVMALIHSLVHSFIHLGIYWAAANKSQSLC